MNHRIHNFLDGEGSGEELTFEERAELAVLQATIDSVVGPLRAAPVPDLSARVMARVAGTSRAPSYLAKLAAAARRATHWFVAPRPVTLRLSPAYALGALAVVALIAGAPRFITNASPGDGTAATAAALPAVQVYVQFRLEAEGASHVALVGSFNGWQPVHELRQTTPGAWSILVPLQPGVHDYAFVVDRHTWIGDPHAFQVDDGFGGANSRLALPSPSARGRT